MQETLTPAYNGLLLTLSWPTILYSIAQISAQTLDDDPGLDRVPLMFGPGGAAENRSQSIGADVEAGMSVIDSIEAFSATGYLFVGPRGVAENIDHCLQEIIRTALTDPGLQQDAARSGKNFNLADRQETRALVVISQGVLATSSKSATPKSAD